MNSPIVLIPPILNVIVTALFAGVVLSQYLRRHRLYQLYWSIALTMAFVATLAYTCMLLVQPTSSVGMLLFRFYYILGGALMPAWLGLGSVALVSKPRVTYICLTFLYIMSALATFLIFFASIDVHALSRIAGTPGTGILVPGPWLVTIIVLNTLGVLAVVGVALYSGWQLLRRQSSVAGFSVRNLVMANGLILLGDLTNGAAGSLARFLGVQSLFWAIMTIGWILFFIGVLYTSRRPRVTPPVEAADKATGTDVPDPQADATPQPQKPVTSS
jgi:hypothetical protein